MFQVTHTNPALARKVEEYRSAEPNSEPNTLVIHEGSFDACKTFLINQFGGLTIAEFLSRGFMIEKFQGESSSGEK